MALCSARSARTSASHACRYGVRSRVRVRDRVRVRVGVGTCRGSSSSGGALGLGIAIGLGVGIGIGLGKANPNPNQEYLQGVLLERGCVGVGALVRELGHALLRRLGRAGGRGRG